MKNKAIIESILCLLKEYKKESAKIHPNTSDMEKLHYLICQTIRQYTIPPDNYHLSKTALSLWKKLSKDDIMKYHYRDIVDCDKISGEIVCDSYKGASKIGTPVTLSKGSKFVFRQIFHEDHVIPVSIIWDKMLKIPVNQNTIENLLNKMHICILLKEEDRRIPTTKGRNLDFNEIINNIYKPAGIYLVK